MENIAWQVQQQVTAARSEVERLMRTSLDQGQVDELRGSGMAQKQIDILYPLTPENYPASMQAVLAKPSQIKWLRRELAKLDPTAYCLYLPQSLYAKVRPALPELPATPSVEQELAYTCAFVNHLAAERIADHAYPAPNESPEAALRRWQNLLHQSAQITKVLKDVQAQLNPMGRAMHRLRQLAR